MGTGVLLITVHRGAAPRSLRHPGAGRSLGARAALRCRSSLTLLAQRFVNRRAGCVVMRLQRRLRAEQPSGADAPPRRDRILRPGVNCWRVERAATFRCVQDGEEYFRLVRDALLAARRTRVHPRAGTSTPASISVRAASSDGAADEARRAARLHRARGARARTLRPHLGLRRALRARARPHEPLRLGWATTSTSTSATTICTRSRRSPPEDRRRRRRAGLLGRLDLTSHRWDTTEHRVETVPPERARQARTRRSTTCRRWSTDPRPAALGNCPRALGAHRRGGAAAVVRRREDRWPADTRPTSWTSTSRSRAPSPLSPARVRCASARRCSTTRSRRRAAPDLHREPVLHEPEAGRSARAKLREPAARGGLRRAAREC